MTWNEFWESISVFQLALWIIGAAAVIGFFVKGWPKIRAFVRLVDSLGALPDFMANTTQTLAAQNEKIEEIHHEVQYNNGTSVKDSIARIEEHLGIDTRKRPARRPRTTKKETPSVQ